MCKDTNSTFFCTRLRLQSSYGDHAFSEFWERDLQKPIPVYKRRTKTASSLNCK